MDYDLILIRYGELSLKSKYVRNRFESILIGNIKNVFRKEDISCNIKREWGRIYLFCDEISKSLDILSKIFGITSFSPVIKSEAEIKQIEKTALKISKEFLTKDKTFAVRAIRTGNHNFSSQDIQIKIGKIIENQIDSKVNLLQPDFELFIEVRDNNSYLFTDKYYGPGGLPFGTQGKVLSIIDNANSLLASWFLMKRGCNIDFVITNQDFKGVLNSFLDNWYISANIHLIDIHEDLSNVILKNNYDAVTTGTSLYNDSRDVISEINNLKQSISIPVLHPLIAFNEVEIETKCKEIGLLA